MPYGRLALAVIVVAGAIGAIGACGDDLATPSSALDGGGPTGAVGEGVCPISPPFPDESCALPEGTTCAFNACGTSIAQCVRGVWRYGGNASPRPACPEPSPPASGSPCPPCWPVEVTCRYGSEDCTSADASANVAVAACSNGAWVISFSPCAPDGGRAADAGADVQGDARANED